METDRPIQLSLRTGILTMFAAALVIAANMFWLGTAVLILDVLLLMRWRYFFCS